MLAFWASGIGGIFLALQWMNSKNKKSPAPKDVILKSLKNRLEKGEITKEEYQKRLKDL